jgi:peroxiredoxin
MVKTASMMMPLGTPAPDFSLPNIDGSIVSLEDFQDSPALVVIFMCNHCPFVIHLAAGLSSFGHEYQAKGAAIVAISSNDVGTHAADAPELMIREAKERGYSFPYLYDKSQDIAKAYQAACTPDFFVFDQDQKLAYRGQFDSSRPDSRIPVTGEDLRKAVDAVVAGNLPADKQIPSIGCNIKWKLGSEPDYFNPSGIS